MSNDCTQMRRMLLKHSTLNLGTGSAIEGTSEWVTRACGTPLFDARSKALGKCPSCERGWTHPHSYPVNEDVPTS